MVKICYSMISLTILSSTLAIAAAVTGIALVGLALWLAGLLSPRSYNVQKGEAYECGIPTRGESMAQFKVGYYLFAILFLMFDVECVFLFPGPRLSVASEVPDFSASLCSFVY